MTDWGLIAIRFALYADLMLLVGLSVFPVYSLTYAEREACAGLLIDALLKWLTFAGLLFSVTDVAISTAAMMGVPLTDVDSSMLVLMASKTDVGTAWSVRLVALVAVLAGFVVIQHNRTARLVFVFAGGTVALATLVWSGHAGATESAIGTAHRISDIAHMVAAALWLGGIAAFCLLLSSRERQNACQVALIARALANFSRVGTVAVVIIVYTGLFNRLVISGADVVSLIQSTYGLLLTAKVILFGTMLGLAANNRWRLIPALGQTLAIEDHDKAWRQLRICMGLEAAAGTCVLITVAWLGTLSPD